MAEKKKAAAGAGKRPAAAPGDVSGQTNDAQEQFQSDSGAQTDPPPVDGGG